VSRTYKKFFFETDMPLSVTWLMMSEYNFYSTSSRSEHLTEVSTRDVTWVGKGRRCVGLLIV